MPQKPDDVTRIALDYATDIVTRTAAPWKIPTKVLAVLREDLAVNFAREVNDYRHFKFWQSRIDRLAKYVGVLAAYLAELEKGFQLKPGTITLAQAQMALLLVRAACPDTGTAVPKGALCGPNVAVASRQPAVNMRKTLLDWMGTTKR